MTSAKDAAQALAARRRKVTVNCARCGKEVSGLRTRRYCCDACRVAAARGHDARSDVSSAEESATHTTQGSGRLTPELLAEMAALREEIARQLPLGYFEESAVDIINAARDERVDEL